MTTTIGNYMGMLRTCLTDLRLVPSGMVTTNNKGVRLTIPRPNGADFVAEIPPKEIGAHSTLPEVKDKAEQIRDAYGKTLTREQVAKKCPPPYTLSYGGVKKSLPPGTPTSLRLPSLAALETEIQVAEDRRRQGQITDFNVSGVPIAWVNSKFAARAATVQGG